METDQVDTLETLASQSAQSVDGLIARIEIIGVPKHAELEPDQALANRNGNVAAKRDLDKLRPKTKAKNAFVLDPLQ